MPLHAYKHITESQILIWPAFPPSLSFHAYLGPSAKELVNGDYYFPISATRRLLYFKATKLVIGSLVYDYVVIPYYLLLLIYYT